MRKKRLLDTKLQSALGAASKRTSIDEQTVGELEAAVTSNADREALKAFLAANGDRFEAGAKVRFEKLVATMPPPAFTWSDLSVPSGRDALRGPELKEGQAVFDALSAKVGTRLSVDDVLLMSQSAAQWGVMGGYQALRAAKIIAGLSEPEAVRFRGILGRTESMMGRAFVFKALAAGSSLDEINAFEQTIRHMGSKEMLKVLNLADPIVDDGQQTGVTQQFHDSCVPTVAQGLRGEFDPIYALSTHQKNYNVNWAPKSGDSMKNGALKSEQSLWLTKSGGTPTARNIPGVGVDSNHIDAVYNGFAEKLGLTFKRTIVTDALPVPAMLDAIAAQLEAGIATPLLVGTSNKESRSHAALALEVETTAEGQRFLIHEPTSGESRWVTRQNLEAGKAGFGWCEVLGGYHQASLTDAP